MTSISRLNLVALLLASFPLLGLGQTTKPSGPLEVHEWAVFVLDASCDKLNPDGLVQSTLPSFVDSHRQAAPGNMQQYPSPMGIIRLQGAADTSVDVKIEKSAGTFLASWPKAQT